MADLPWTDLLDPDEPKLRPHLPGDVHARALEQLLRPAHADDVRPVIEGHGDYVFGVLLAAVAVPTEDRVYYQEVDFVLMADHLVTVRKTPPDGEPYDLKEVQEVCAQKERLTTGVVTFHLVDDVAERYLDLLDDLEDEIDEVEEGVESWPGRRIRERLSDLRHDLLQIRRTLAPTRDAVRGIVDGRVDIEGRPLFRREVFSREVELHFADVYDKLLRASESLEYARDLLGSVRDYHQSKIANDQNEVMKKLTAIASILLVPTFIVGVYGQNFRRIPELHWGFGYAWSWGLIVLTTIAQVVYFRRKGWL